MNWPSDRISKIRSITQPQRVLLRGHRITTQIALRALLDKGDALTTLATFGGENRKWSAEQLAKSLEWAAKPSLFRHLGIHWADGVFIVLIGLFSYAVLKPVVSPKPFLSATRDIPAFHTVKTEDLSINNLDHQQLPQRRTGLIEAIVGRYSTSAIKQGSPIPMYLLRGPADLQGKVILKLEIKAAPPLEASSLPIIVNLFFSSRQQASTSSTLHPLLLELNTEVRPTIATLALSPQELQEATKWLGSADAYLGLG